MCQVLEAVIMRADSAFDNAMAPAPADDKLSTAVHSGGSSGGAIGAVFMRRIVIILVMADQRHPEGI
ncbi:hypothetical protein J6590_004404 [Homalodisca vitripennis]|nr:hypothetical protein J6590_004404 [Homalodisca vitripennis]